MLRRFVVLCAALVAFQAVILAQPTIVGPDSGKPGQALSYQLLDQGRPVSGVIWTQGFNPDRYSGNDYATSFRLKVTPQPDGSVQIVAPSPGRYRLVGTAGGGTFPKAVLIRSDTPFPPLPGLSFWLSVDPYNGPDQVRPRASDRLAVAKHMGVEWIALASEGCLNLDQVDSANFEEVWDTTTCYGVSQADLEWIIDEAHHQGFKVTLHGGAGAAKGGVFVGDLQMNISGLTDTQLMKVHAAYSRFHVNLASIAQRHSVEAIFVGENWQTPFTSSSQLLGSLHAGWLSLIAQVRAAYSGELWFGWANICGPWVPAAEFDAWSTVDSVHLLGTLKGSGPVCEWPQVTGYSNMLADDLLPGLSDLANPVGYGSAPFGLYTGRPVIWTDVYSRPIDSFSWNEYPSGLNTYQALDGQHPLDNQESVDVFEAMTSRVKSGVPRGLFVWAMDLWSLDRTALLANPSLVHSMANWYGGDPTYFESCLTPQAPDVLFQSNFSCPLGRYSVYLRAPADLVPDTDNSARQVLRLTSTGAVRFALPDNVAVNQTVRLRSSSASLSMFIRWDGTRSYEVDLGATGISLKKNVGTSPAKTLGSYTTPPIGTAWQSLGVSAVDTHIVISLGGKTIIDVNDQAAPALSGTGRYGVSGTGDVEISDFVVRQPPLVPTTPDSPLVQAVVNGASYLGVTVAPGEIVTLFGTQMGPAKLAYFAPDQNGKIGTTLAGTRVLFDGVAAPLIYTQAGQVTAIVPFGVEANSTNIQVEYQGKTSPALNVPVTDTTLGIFTANSGGDGEAAAINQDGTFNSASNAASRGTVLTLFLTGHGQVNPSGVDGAIVTGTPPKIVAATEVWIGHVPAQIQYAGVAPQSTNGLMQLNVVVPAGAPTGSDIPILVGMGHYVSQPGVTVAIK